ncbi:pentapeptide repeat-containing protein [Iningainema tapete]|uniref:Pentapeptide repeat-containing protein n=1 Tax=Iningainema tapete BLCC-T55 TaxID=2748662 RepID=A0A8J6XSP4_9CYAN|nr:pentapeptide repeat-containing protein [Iningainema tapete]MBD2776796.1 pentapeptide repeat-containing protein [Iningainema tapete BLCC-T55]
MKISFAIGPKERNITQPEAFDISYEHKGCICTVMVYGDINKPQVLVVPPTPLPTIPISRYWFFMNISWSKLDGFEFNHYSDPEITTHLNSAVCNSTVGILRGEDKIQINNTFLTLTFRAEVSQTDLSKNDPIIFLEKCSEFGIRVANVELSEFQSLYKLNCSGIKLYNVVFINSDIREADFNSSSFNDVKFINSNLERANFSNSLFSKVELLAARLRETVFDNCRVFYNKSRIENDETLIFNNCDLTNSSFVKAVISSKLEYSNLSNADFSEAKLVACKLYDCTLNGTIFTKSIFSSYETQSNNPKKPSTSSGGLITCYIGPKSETYTTKGVANQGNITNCKFDSASMNFVDLSNNLIKSCDFEAADLSKAKLSNCEFIGTAFNGRTLKPANLSSADTSFSVFREECNLNEVNFTRVRMIESRIEKCRCVRSIFYGARLISSYFVDSNLTGADFRNADLTMINLDKCLLSGANFFKTIRGGINLNIQTVNEQSNKEEQINIKSSCDIKFIDWSPKKDGEIQINENDFLSIIIGSKSAVSVISNLSKENPSVISYIYNQAQAEANAQSAGNDLNDASVNIDGDVNNGDISGGSIETQPYGVSEQDEEQIPENYDSYSGESSNKEDEQE